MAAGGGAKKYIVTAADIGRFVIIAGLGALSIITFLVAGTIVVLMAVDSSGCCITYFPVGLSVLGLLGLFFLIDIIVEAVYTPSVFQEWFLESENNRQLLLLVTISLVAIWLVT